jgi:RNA polymerase sigma factor (sigma-70 family)
VLVTLPLVDLGELVSAALLGDERSWSELVDRFANLVWAIARNHSLDDSDAADVSQTTWLRLAESLDSIKDPERIGAWLATCARRESLRILRSRHRDLLLYVHEDDFDTMESPREEELAGDSEALLKAFASLPPTCQTLLRAMFATPIPSYSELAEELNMPIGSIGPTRGRCLARLRKALQSQLATDPGPARGRKVS